MLPAEVLDLHRDLIERTEGDPRFKFFIANMVAASYARDHSDEYEQAIEWAQPAVAALVNHLRAAYPYRVTHDMCMLVQHAAAGLDNLDRFDRDLAPTGAGFVRFERPLPYHDVRGKTMLIHTLVWGPGSVGDDPGLALWMFNDSQMQPDEVTADYLAAKTDPGDREAARQMIGRHATVGFFIAVQDRRMGPAQVEPSPEQQARVLASGDTPTAASNIIRYVHALFLLLNQTITATDHESPDRAGARRAKRASLPSQVTVIRLRRAEHTTRREGETLVEWTRRWLVRGHWAWRHCSDHHPGAVPYKDGWGVRVWISGYEKNAHRTDLPLVVPDKLMSLDR